MNTILNKIKRNKVVRKSYIYVYENIFRLLFIIEIGFYSMYKTLKYSGCKNDRSIMRVSCHIIEKGLTMPNRRFGFGFDRMRLLIKELLTKKYELNEYEYNYGLALVKEYKELHDKNLYILPNDIAHDLELLSKEKPDIKALRQIETTKKLFFDKRDKPFPEFSYSRHTVRDFSSSVDLKLIYDSILIALNAPSACNRQAVKCHIFNDYEEVQKILYIQNGNRGFGHLIPQLCIVTFDTKILGVKDQNDGYTNAGIFTMNLCYALHYNRIGVCILNWTVVPRIDRKLRKLTHIPESENIVLLLGIGNPNEEIKIAQSLRKNLDDTVILHKQ